MRWLGRLCGIGLSAALGVQATAAELSVTTAMAVPVRLAGAAGVSGVSDGAPADGFYAADFCTGPAARASAQAAERADEPAALQCSAARVELAPRRARALLHDFVYRFRFDATELTLTLSQGPMQIDDFSAAYAWHGKVLRFTDAEKGVRYEVRLGRRLASG